MNKAAFMSRKVYAFDDAVSARCRFAIEPRSIAYLRKLRDKIFDMEYRVGAKKPHILFSSKCGQSRYEYDDDVIILRKIDQNIQGLVHEMAHGHVRRGFQHGPTFQRTYQNWLVRYARVKLSDFSV